MTHRGKEGPAPVTGRAWANFKQFPPAFEVEGQNDHQVRTMLLTHD
jgi:hypothetical protein